MCRSSYGVGAAVIGPAEKSMAWVWPWHPLCSLSIWLIFAGRDVQENWHVLQGINFTSVWKKHNQDSGVLWLISEPGCHECKSIMLPVGYYSLME
jgi:hypothetical protein